MPALRGNSWGEQMDGRLRVVVLRCMESWEALPRRRESRSTGYERYGDWGRLAHAENKPV
eukprot:719107-Pleurochrysis_carterae.AAC.7